MMWRKSHSNQEQAGLPAASGSTPTWLMGLLLVLAIVIAYHPVWHAGFIWDDDDYVTENPLLTATNGLRRIWFSLDSPSQYFPLTYTTFYVERGLWGLNPAGYHLVNLLLHAANALLVWRILLRLKVPGAWLGAALFALHPVQVESVAWVTERKNVLMGLFYLLSILSWIRFTKAEEKGGWGYYGLALASYGLALSAKTTACTLPAALLLVLWWQGRRLDWRRWLQVTPFVAMGLGMGLVTVWWERHHQGTQGELFAIGPMERVLIASHAIWFYLGKLIWPAPLIFSYPRWEISAKNPWAYGWLGLTMVAGWLMWRWRERTGKGVVAAALYFVTTLGPVLGFIMLYTFLYSFVADHYQYLACIGPLALAGAGLSRLGTARPYVGAVLLAVLGALTWHQCLIYADAQTLWEATLRQNPASWMAENNLGNELLEKNKVDEAMAHFHDALKINPRYAEAFYNLGVSLRKQGKLDDAVEQYHKALDIRPEYAPAHYNLGNVLAQQGHLDQAAAEYETALRLSPDYAGAQYNLATTYLQMGRLNDAFIHFQKAIEVNPGNADAHYNLGNMYGQQGRAPDAVREFEQALQIRPNFAEAEDGLGNCCAQTGKLEEAIAHYQKAVEQKPDFAEAQKSLAWILATAPQPSLRNGPKAVELAERANRLTGGKDPLVLCTLAAACAEAGKFADATASVQKALAAAGSAPPGMIQQLNAQLQRYQAGLPLHQ